MNEQKQVLLNALPATGEITYDDFRQKVVTQGQEQALEQFHAMRRKEQIKVRMDSSTGAVVLYLSRP